MTCRDVVLSDDYIDYIWKVDAQIGIQQAFEQGECAQYVNRNFAIFYRNKDAVLTNDMELPIGDYALSSCLTQMNTESLEISRILTIQNQPALHLRGNGVIIGFLDSGERVILLFMLLSF